MPLDGGTNWNVTHSTMSFAPDYLGFLVSFVIIIAMIFAVFIAFYSVEYLTRVIKALGKVAATFKYALYGLAISAGFWCMFYIVESLRKAAGGFDVTILGYGIGAYIAFYILGRLGEYMALRMLKTYRDYNGTATTDAVHDTVSMPPSRNA